MPTILKFTYPNGKIYVARDMINSVHAEIKNRSPGFDIRIEVLWEATAAHSSEVSSRQTEIIQQHHANDPAIGYNRWPRYTKKTAASSSTQVSASGAKAGDRD